jgi:hypothetical protein
MVTPHAARSAGLKTLSSSRPMTTPHSIIPPLPPTGHRRKLLHRFDLPDRRNCTGSLRYWLDPRDRGGGFDQYQFCILQSAQCRFEPDWRLGNWAGTWR